MATKADKSFYYAFNSNKVRDGDSSMFIVEFQFPDAQASTWVLARRHFKGHIEIGEPVDSRGGKVFQFAKLEDTKFNISGCTGRMRPFNPNAVR